MKQASGTEAIQRVRDMRRSPTETERLMWTALRGRRLSGLKFRRQVWIDSYIADFLCGEARIVIELDGSQHADTEHYDDIRDRRLADEGYQTLRIWNNDVTDNLEGVLETIRLACEARLPSPSRRGAAGPSLSLAGEGI